ncbi:MAG: hypothetical protein Q9175_004019 [Cornicularia normoerica]
MTPPQLQLPTIRVSDIEILTDWDFENVKAFGDSIPGFRSSSTFLSTLRSNLQLASDLSPLNSLVSTPTTPGFAISHLPQPSSLSITTTASKKSSLRLDPKPKPILSTALAPPGAPEDRSAALRLIADSVVQQRQLAAKELVLHPATLAFIVLVIAALAQFCEWRPLFTAVAGLTVAALAAIYWITIDYATLAERINWDWLGGYTPPSTPTGERNSGIKKQSKCDDPVVLVSKWGEEVIGALVMKVVKRERKAYVRAWTVDSSCRGKGIGSGLLEEGVRVAWGKGARAFEFERGHANSHRVLPPLFNGGSEKRDATARVVLADVVKEIRRERSSR